MGFQLKNIEASKKERSNSFDLDLWLKKEIRFGNSFSNKQKEAFYVELHVLLDAGLPLKEGLSLLAEEQKKQKDKKLLQTLIKEIVDGKNFSESIKNQAPFTPYEYYSIQIGEQSGSLLNVTKELGAFFKRKNQQRRTVISALTYPVVVLSTAFFAILFMLQFVVPMFADIFKQNKVELPWITTKIIQVSYAFRNYWWLILVFLLVFMVLHVLLKNKIWVQKYTAILILKLPFVGEFVRKVKIAQFTQAITLLTSAKVPLLNGIQLTRKMIRFYPLEVALEKIEQDVLQGKSLHLAMNSYAIFDKKMISLIKVAEETNQNETIFKRLSEQYNHEIEHKSNLLSTAIEPFIILVLGAIVAVILIAIYLPMFKLSTVIS